MNNPALPDNSKRDFAEMGLFDHLTELRQRLIKIFIAVIIASFLAYSFSGYILDFLFAPFYQHFDSGKGMLIGTGPAEAFLLKIKVAVFAGVLLACPVIFMQIWLFIEPGLYENERRYVIPFVLATSFLFLAGVGFCFEVVLPFAFEFFRQQYDSIGQVVPAIKVDEHLALVIQALLGFGLVFETPVLAFILGRLGVIDHKMMIGGVRYATVIIFIISAIFTPPDVLTQFLMAIPLLLLYGLSILIVKYTAKQQGKVTGGE